MYLIVGRIVRPHGINGEVIVDVRTDDPGARFTVGASLATSAGPDTPPGTQPAAKAASAGSASAGSAGTAPVGGPARPGASAVGTSNSAAASVSADGEPLGERWTVPDRLTIEVVRSHQGRLIVSFAGVADRNVAEALRGVVLWVDAAELSDPEDPDEFHDHQLVGLAAVTPAGEALGEVTGIDHAPASDLLLLRRPAGGTALVPFVKEIVPEVDLAAGRVVIDPPEGLFDL